MIRMSWDAIISLGSLPRMRGDDPSGGARSTRPNFCLPRMRGDDPAPARLTVREAAFAPHARG